MNVYRGSVGEAAKNKRLRAQMNPAAAADSGGAAPGNEGVKISMIVSEVESVGGFGRLEILGAAAQRRHAAQHLRLHDLHAALDGAGRAGGLLPQHGCSFHSCRRRSTATKRRIQTMRALSVDIVDEAAVARARARTETFVRRIADIYRLNMQIFVRKYGMNFLMNLLHQVGSSASSRWAAGWCCRARPRWARSSPSSRAEPHEQSVGRSWWTSSAA